jgi:hypothetical protein
VSPSVRERILQAVMQNLQAAIQPLGAKVLRSPTTGIPREQSPALAVFPESDTIRERPNDRVERELVIRIVALARASATESPEIQADRLLVTAHRVLMVDVTFGGLALGLRELDCEWDVEDADATACAIPARYEVRYRTLVSDLTLTG